MAAASTCEACGASRGVGARRCGACGAAAPEATCARCYHASDASAARCDGCGEELGLEPVGAPGALRCAACYEQTRAFDLPGGRLYDCLSCGGQFVDLAALAALVAAHEGRPGPRPAARLGALDALVRYRACPICHDRMNRKNFAGSSGVVVDVCRAHGTFFDRGELPRLLAFVGSGGLERARLRREREAKERERSRAATARVGPTSASSRWSLGHDPEVIEGVLDLLGMLLD
jgi:Zn-finger nucleic acid-binding protein